jgi:hypothetical protein
VFKYYKVTNILKNQFAVLEEDDGVFFRWDYNTGWYSIYAHSLEYYEQTPKVYKVEEITKEKANQLMMMDELIK